MIDSLPLFCHQYFDFCSSEVTSSVSTSLPFFCFFRCVAFAHPYQVTLQRCHLPFNPLSKDRQVVLKTSHYISFHRLMISVYIKTISKLVLTCMFPRIPYFETAFIRLFTHHVVTIERNLCMTRRNCFCSSGSVARGVFGCLLSVYLIAFSLENRSRWRGR